MLWFALAVMTGLAVLAALWPLAFRRAPGREAASEAAFYKAQLDEIERDVDRGQLPEREAQSARAETGRRLIAAYAVKAGPAAPGDSVLRRRAAASFIFVMVPLVALAAYVWAGRPDLPDAPLASREKDSASPDAVEAMIAKLQGRLAAAPDDAKGWSVLATVYMHLERYSDAAGAFQQLLRLDGENGELRADYGEALVAAAGGNVVTADARAAFDKALADTPGLPKARFYLALAAEQDGETQKAIAQYQSLIDDAKGDEPWKPAVAARLAALKGEPAPAAPRAEASAGIEGMSADQQKMVRGMVERLATRLGQSGGSAEEWTRLIRAYSVLHETGKAKETLLTARAALGSDTAAVANLDTLARDLGLAERTP